MPGQSSIKKLPPEIRAEVDAAIRRGATVDAIVETIKALGGEASRSAVGRYQLEYRELAAKTRDMQAVATAFAAEFGEPGNHQGKLMIQLLTTLLTRAAMGVVTEDAEGGLDFKEIHYLARAVKDATDASKTDIERDAKIALRARQQAANDAEAAGKAAGASPETIARIKAKILGIDGEGAQGRGSK